MSAEEILARSGRTFHLASRLLPRRTREEAAELYAFCRRMDDLADTPQTENGAMLAAAVAALEDDPLGPAAEQAGWPVVLEECYPGLANIAATLTRALAADTGPRRIDTEEQLLAYAFGVAGTVGLMMCRILGAPPAGATAASHLGIAMQLTNIARDVREDWERDRVYLPCTWVAPAEVEAAMRGGSGTALGRALGTLLQLADRYYASGHTGMCYLPLRARTAILAAAGCYREIGAVVERDPALSWRSRAVVDSRRKAALVARALAFAPTYSVRRARA